MITQEQAEQRAREWVDAFNRHDLEAVLAHYAVDIEFRSPVVVELLHDPSGTIQGKDALRPYFERGLARFPNLAFELVHVLAGVDGLTIVHRGTHRDRLGAEIMCLNSQGQIDRVTVHYGQSAEAP